MFDPIDVPISDYFEIEPLAIDADLLRANLDAADPAILVLCAAHIAGDLAILDRFGPAVRREPAKERNALPEVTMDAVLRDELIEILVSAVSAGAMTPSLLVDELDVFAKMVDLAVGENVADEFHDLLLEQSGFIPDQPLVPRDHKPDSSYSIAILGAGMAGIAAAVQADRHGFDYTVYERSDDIGGTWRVNNYPGVAVDTPSLYYSYSFELNAQWSRYYPVGGEYQEYLRRVVDKFDVKSHIQFETEVTSLQWIESDSQWEIGTRTRDGEVSTSRASAVITAFGYLNRPKFPDVPGLDTFKGQSVHTAEWGDVDLAGKRVAVIGAGATSIQVVDAIAEQVSGLTLFQRQPHWVMPNKLSDPNVPASEAWLLANLPYYNQWYRLKTYWSASDNGYGIVRADPEWMKSHVSISEDNDAVMQIGLAYLQASFADRPDLLEKMTPDYAPAGKRLIRDPGNFYGALKRPNASVVTEKISQVVSDGIVTADGVTHEFDVIVYATGFTLDFLSPVRIVGRTGKTLNEVWRGDDPYSYLGGTIPGFPNLFVTSAPNSSPAHGGGHNFTVEMSLHFIYECLQLLVENGARSIEVTESTTTDYNDRVEAALENSVWTTQTGANTYYRNKSGRVILPSPWRMVDSWKLHRLPTRSAFEIR